MDNKLDKLIELNNVGYTIFAFIVLNLILISLLFIPILRTITKNKNLIQLAYHIVVLYFILVSFM